MTMQTLFDGINIKVSPDTDTFETFLSHLPAHVQAKALMFIMSRRMFPETYIDLGEDWKEELFKLKVGKQNQAVFGAKSGNLIGGLLVEFRDEGHFAIHT